MKKSDLKKTHILRRILYSRLVSSFRHALIIIRPESESTSNSRFSKKGLSEIFLTYDELQKIATHLLKMERQKAEAIQLIRKHNQLI